MIIILGLVWFAPKTRRRKMTTRTPCQSRFIARSLILYKTYHWEKLLVPPGQTSFSRKPGVDKEKPKRGFFPVILHNFFAGYPNT